MATQKEEAAMQARRKVFALVVVTGIMGGMVGRGDR